MATDGPSSPRIFVSHSHQDSAFCRAYVNGLRAQGLDVWYDEHNLGSGALRTTIERELQNRDHFIVILSPAAISSDWVNAEIDGALALMRRGQVRVFLPVVAAFCDVPVLLDRYKRIVGPDGGSVGIEEAIGRTLQALSMAASASTADGVSAAPAVRGAGPGALQCAYRGHSDHVLAVAWSPDGHEIASCGKDGTVQIWDAVTGEQRLEYSGHSGEVSAVAWARDGKWVASGGEDTTVQVWSAAEATHRVTYGGHQSFVYSQAYGGHRDGIRRIVWSPQDDRIASADGRDTQIWDAARGRVQQRIENVLYGYPAWRPDWKYLAGQDHASKYNQPVITVLEVESLKVIRTYPELTDSLRVLAWSPDGQWLACGTQDHLVYVWNWPDSAQPLIFREHADSISTLCWSPDSHFIASLDDTGALYVWDVRRRLTLLSLDADGDYRARAAWSPDGRHIASISGKDRIVFIWQAIPGAAPLEQEGHEA